MEFKKREHKRLSLDVTPLIDVIFLLLIFFMISTTFPDSPGIKINLPEAASKAATVEKQPLSINITEAEEFFIKGQKNDKPFLANALKEAMEKEKQETLIIRADGKVEHQLVVFVMDTAKIIGIQKLSIATIPPKEK